MGFDSLLKELENRGLKFRYAFKFASVFEEYHHALIMLKRYDEQGIETVSSGIKNTVVYPTEEEVLTAIDGAKSYLEKKGETVGQFGLMSHGNAYSAIENVKLDVFGEEIYPTFEEKAANMFYFLIKNHYFADGNKRIGSLILLWFLDINDMLVLRQETNVFSYNVIFALATLVAESKASEKQVVVNFIVLIIRGYYYDALEQD